MRMRSRHLVQAGFLLLTVAGVWVFRGNAEAWCPFGGVEALFGYLSEGNLLCSLAVSNFFILGGVLGTAVLLRRAFCGYACPIGTISEWTRRLGARVGIPVFSVRGRLDVALSLLKYAVLAIVIVLTWRAGELIFRGFDPCYALIGRHGEDITFWAYVVGGGILGGSLLISLPFCRWLCPLAAVLNPFSRFGAGRIVRDSSSCVDCGKCESACPLEIPVHLVEEVKAARCTACLECVDSCPTRGGPVLSWRFPGTGQRAHSRASVIVVFLLVLGTSVGAAVLSPFPSFTWTRSEATTPVESLEIEIEGLTCRGRANLLVYYLERDDDLALSGFLRFEAWPGPGAARARVSFDPAATDIGAILEAISEPYYDYDTGQWRMSPFRIAGYDPLRRRYGAR